MPIQNSHSFLFYLSMAVEYWHWALSSMDPSSLSVIDDSTIIYMKIIFYDFLFSLQNNVNISKLISQDNILLLNFIFHANRDA